MRFTIIEPDAFEAMMRTVENYLIDERPRTLVPRNCQNCGAPLPVGAYICEYCGTSFEFKRNKLTAEKKDENTPRTYWVYDPEKMT